MASLAHVDRRFVILVHDGWTLLEPRLLEKVLGPYDSWRGVMKADELALGGGPRLEKKILGLGKHDAGPDRLSICPIPQ